MKRRSGKVTFVGAGPGDPGLLTTRGLDAMRRADVVVYDGDLGDDLISLCRRDAERIPTGVEGGPGPQFPEEVKALLADRARRGLEVVRLRRGDPLTSAHGPGEMLHLRQQGIEFSNVPGLLESSAIPSIAGIPVLQPGVTGSMLVIDGLVTCDQGSRESSAEKKVKVTPAPTEPRRPGVVIKRHRKSKSEGSGIFRIRGAEGEVAVEEQKAEDPSLSKIDMWSPDDTRMPQVPLSDQFVLSNESPADAINIDWKAACKAAETLVFTRPLPCLDAIREGLLMGGRSPHEPVAAVASGATPQQRTVVTSIENLVRDVSRKQLQPPCMLIVGDAVNLQEHLNLYEQRPLFGVRLAVTRSESRNEETCRIYREAGAQVLPFPLEQTRPVAGLPQVLDAMRDDLRLATHIVFTTETSVEVFMEGLREGELDLRLIPENCHVISVGPMTQTRLREHGIQSQQVREPFTNDNLSDAFDVRMTGDRVLILGSTESRPELTKELHIRGANVTTVPVYEQQPSKLHLLELRQALTRGDVDCVAFFSATTVQAVSEAWGERTMKRLLGDICIASISEATSLALAGCGLTATIEAQRPTLENLSKMMARWRLDASTYRHEPEALHDLENW